MVASNLLGKGRPRNGSKGEEHMICVWDNVLPDEAVTMYYNKINSHFKEHCEKGFDKKEWYPARNIDVTDDLIAKEVQQFIESKLRVKLSLVQAELQTWYVGSFTDLHTHTNQERENGDFNSLLYLNHNFEGGEFYTKNIVVSPIANRLTFFNGKETAHGLKKVQGNDRHTIILWWKNTIFY